MDCGSFGLKFRTQRFFDIMKKLEKFFDFNNLVKNHKLFSDKNEKVVGKCKIETPKNFWIVEFICLRNKT